MGKHTSGEGFWLLNSCSFLNKIQTIWGYKNSVIIEIEKYRLSRKELSDMFFKRIKPDNYEEIWAVLPKKKYERINEVVLLKKCSILINEIKLSSYYTSESIGNLFMERLVFDGCVVAMKFLVNHSAENTINRCRELKFNYGLLGRPV